MVKSKRSLKWVLVIVVASVATAGCSSSDVVAQDSSAPDARLDAASKPDVERDAAVPDMAALDAPAPDTRAPDAPTPDVAAPDKAVPDTTPPDSATPDLAQAVPDLKPDTGPIKCGGAKVAYSGKLCGPATKPCKNVVSEQLNKSQFRNGGPSLALDAKGVPTVFYATASGGYGGFLARRDGPNSWTTTKMPMAAASASITHGAGGLLHALVEDGALGGGALWRRSGTQWTKLDQLLTKGHGGWTMGLAADQGGCLHAMASSSFNYDLFYARREATWTTLKLASTNEKAPVVLSPAGKAHVAYRAAKYAVTWVAPPGKAEQASPSSMASGQPIPMVVTAGAGAAEIPHLFFNRAASVGKGHELVYARRDGANKWTTQVIASSSVNSCNINNCSQTYSCTFDYWEYVPVAAVASASGDVRLVLAHLNHKGSQGWSPPYGCTEISTITGDLHLAWEEPGKGIKQVKVLSGLGTSKTAEAALDAKGNIHLGLYTASGVGHPAAQYVMIGP